MRGGWWRCRKCYSYDTWKTHKRESARLVRNAIALLHMYSPTYYNSGTLTFIIQYSVYRTPSCLLPDACAADVRDGRWPSIVRFMQGWEFWATCKIWALSARTGFRAGHSKQPTAGGAWDKTSSAKHAFKCWQMISISSYLFYQTKIIRKILYVNCSQQR